jgi:large subunit ribosomal protein L3
MNLNMGLLGRKIGMTQIHDEDGIAVLVTAIDAGPCTVLQIKTPGGEGYSAIQIGFDPRPERNVPEDVLKRAQGARARYELTHSRSPKPERGHSFAAGESAPHRFVREIRLSQDDAAGYEPGQQITTEIFEKGQYVDVVGTSKGRGFTGVVKRHGFAMFPKTHGTHEWRRHGGSIGCRKPMRTRRGQRMAGQHGNARITVQNLKVADVLPDQNVLLVRGAVPGPNGGFVVIRKAIKKK